MKALLTVFIICFVASVGARASTGHCHTYELPDIHSLELNAFAAIDIHQGKVNELKVSADNSFIEYLDIKIKDSTLIVRDTRSHTYWLQQPQFFKHLKDQRNAPSNIHFLLTLKNPENIMLTGYLATRVSGIRTPNMSITFTGSGSLNLHKVTHDKLDIQANGHIKTTLQYVSAENGNIRINGNGKVEVAHADFEQLAFLLNGRHQCTLEGKARNLQLTMQGTGTCSGQDFIARNAQIGLQGSSELTLGVDDFLQATTLDSSRIRYYGKAEVKNNGADVTRLAASTPTHMYF